MDRSRHQFRWRAGTWVGIPQVVLCRCIEDSMGRALSCSQARWLLPIFVTALCGCAQLRLPAIDPSGRSIFLPRPAFTTLNHDDSGLLRHLSGGRSRPRPAYEAPPPLAPVNVVPPVPADPVLPTLPQLAPPQLPPLPVGPQPYTNELRTPANVPQSAGLTLNPRHLIAPVGQPVALIAGLCGVDGHYITDVPLEWMLSQNSAGMIVDAGNQPRHRWLNHFRYGSVTEKRSSNYSITRTSSRGLVANHGTTDPVDDTILLSGQSFIRIFSPTEGTSEITVFASESDQWDRQYQTAKIHWIDGQWTFPPPAISQSGQPQTLTASISRQTSSAPAAGWLVRYEIVDGPPASFDVQGAQAVEVPTDRYGRASAQVIPQGIQGGVTRIRVQINKPGPASNPSGRLMVGEGWTSVTWSDPGLAISISGPTTAEVDAEVEYRIDVSNPGVVTVRDVVVGDALPDQLEFLAAQPAGQVFGNQLEWTLPEVPANGTHAIYVRCRINRSGSVRHCVTASSGDLQADHCVETNVLDRPLTIKILDESPEVQVGQTIQYRMIITNTGSQRLENVTLTDRFDMGLVHVTSDVRQAHSSPIEVPLGALAPGQSKRQAITFQVMRAGRLCHVLSAGADGVAPRIRKMCFNAVQKPQIPAVEATYVGSAGIMRSGEEAQFEFTVQNTGEVPLTNVVVREKSAPGIQAVRATNYDEVTGPLTWQIQRLDVGQEVVVSIVYRAVGVGPGIRSQITVTTDQNVSLQKDYVVEILAPDRSSAGGDSQLPGQPAGNRDVFGDNDFGDDRGQPFVVSPTFGKDDVQMSVSSLSNPIRVGDTVRFLLTMKNNGQRNVRDVVIKLTLSKNLAFNGSVGDVGFSSVDEERTVYESEVIKTIRRGETISLQVTAAAEHGGAAVLNAQLRSGELSQRLDRSVEITVLE